MLAPVGFMAIEPRAGCIVLLRKLLPGGEVFEHGTSGGSIRRAAENPAALPTLHVIPKTFSFPMSLRLVIALFGIVCSVVVLSTAFWAIVVPLGLLLGWSCCQATDGERQSSRALLSRPRSFWCRAPS